MSQRTRLYQVGGRPIARATFADANAKRPAGVFCTLFAHMAAAASRRTRLQSGDSLGMLDATRIRLSSLSGGWADMIGRRRAIKVHLTYDPLADLSLAAAVTGQRTNDICAGRMTEILPGVTR